MQLAFKETGDLELAAIGGGRVIRAEQAGALVTLATGMPDFSQALKSSGSMEAQDFCSFSWSPVNRLRSSCASRMPSVMRLISQDWSSCGTV